MQRRTSVALGLALPAVAIAGCAGRIANAPVMSAQQDCERTGGIWRSNTCERTAGGGGY